MFMAHVSDSDDCGIAPLSQPPFISVSDSSQQQQQQQPLVDFAFASQESSSNHKFAAACELQSTMEQPLSVSAQETKTRELGFTPSGCDVETFDCAKVHLQNEDSGLENVLDVKKKRLLEELESVLLPKDEFSGEMMQEPSLGIEVIDETALVETVPASGIGKKSTALEMGSKKEMDVKNGKQSRRRAKGARKVMGVDGRHTSVTGMDEDQAQAQAQNGNGTKRKYPRKELEALRFLDMGEQRKIWKAIYSGLQTVVAKEYDNLASSEHQKHIRLNYDPRQCLAKKKEAPAILSVGAANGRWRYMNVFVH